MSCLCWGHKAETISRGFCQQNRQVGLRRSCCPSTQGQLQHGSLRPPPGDQEWCRALPDTALLLTCHSPLQHQQWNESGTNTARLRKLQVSLTSKQLPLHLLPHTLSTFPRSTVSTDSTKAAHTYHSDMYKHRSFH